MLALGLQGSPRKKGNSDLLLSAFMEALGQKGVHTRTIDVPRGHIEPCKELTVCEKKGTCPIDDDMGRDIYALLRQADIIIAASPIFFYNVSAQLKALIDRCQTLWARKYILKLRDPGHGVRRGFFLTVGASRGKQLFEGLHLTAKYFFDAVDARYVGSLTYRGVEGRGEIAQHATMAQDVIQAAAELADGLAQRHKVLFVGRQNAGCSKMAAAFARLYAGERLDVASAGIALSEGLDPAAETVMQEKGIDMAFQKPLALTAAVNGQVPNDVITVGCDPINPLTPNTRHIHWELPGFKPGEIDTIRTIRDAIEQRVKAYIDNL